MSNDDWTTLAEYWQSYLEDGLDDGDELDDHEFIMQKVAFHSGALAMFNLFTDAIRRGNPEAMVEWQSELVKFSESLKQVTH